MPLKISSRHANARPPTALLYNRRLARLSNVPVHAASCSQAFSTHEGKVGLIRLYLCGASFCVVGCRSCHM